MTFKICTPLGAAAREGNLKLVQSLVDSGADIENGGVLGSPLLHAVNYGHLPVCAFLIIHGANPSPLNRFGWTPLHAASASKLLPLVELLLALGVPVNPIEQFRSETPLLHACAAGSHRIARLLLQSGAAIDVRDRDQNTALHLAAQSGDEKTVKLLLEHGLSPDNRNHRGRTPLQLTCRNRKPTDGHRKVIELLLRAGAEPDAPDFSGGTPELDAIEFRFESAKEAIAEHKASHRAALLIAQLLKIL